MISLEALEQAFSHVEKIGQGEKTFDVGGTPVTVRVLLPHEETAVQVWASSDLEDTDEDNPSGVFAYLDKFRLGTLSHAIVQIGDLDLRGVEFIATGEKLPNGAEVKIAKHEAVQKLIQRWSTTVRDGVFKKFTELLEDVSRKTENAIEFAPSDYEVEVRRLEERIEHLKAQMEAEEKRTGFRHQADKIAKLSEQDEAPDEGDAPAPEVAEVAEAPEQATEQAPKVPAQRQRVGPQRAAPPPQAVPQPPAPQERQEHPQQHDPDSSLVSSDNLEAAVEAENRRLLEQRAMAAQGVQPMEPSGSALDAVRNVRGRIPPHVAAKETADAVMPAEPVAQVGGVDAFRLDEPQQMGAKPPGKGGATINPSPQGRQNPRFRPPPKP